MTRDAAFLEAIRVAPDDDAPRLIYADWLDERGDPRGQFIRVQCQQARLPPSDPRRQPLFAEAGDLLRANWEVWVGPLRDLVGPNASRRGDGWLWGGHDLRHLAKFRRGFVEALAFGAADFLRRAEAVFRTTPLRYLRIWGGGAHAAALAESPWLADLQALDFPDYYSDPLTAEGAAALAPSPHLRRLAHLRLYRNDVADAGAAALAAAPWAAGLRSLNLTENGLSAAGAQALAESPYLGGLVSLYLASNRLGDEGAEALLAGRFWSEFRAFDVSDCGIGESALARLRRRFGDGVRPRPGEQGQ